MQLRDWTNSESIQAVSCRVKSEARLQATSASHIYYFGAPLASILSWDADTSLQVDLVLVMSSPLLAFIVQVSHCSASQ